MSTHTDAARAALEAANVPAAVVGLRLLGHSVAGDGGGALYKRVPSEPSHPGKIQSADGAWWEIAETLVNARQFGATGSGSGNDATALQTMFDYMEAKGMRGRLPGSSCHSSIPDAPRRRPLMRWPPGCRRRG